MFTQSELRAALQGNERVADKVVSCIMDMPVDDSGGSTKIGAMCRKWLKTLPDYEYDDLINLARTYLYACLGFMNNEYKVKYDAEKYGVDPERFIRYFFMVFSTRVLKISYRQHQKQPSFISIDNNVFNVIDTKPPIDRKILLSMAFDDIVRKAKGKNKIILEGVLSYFRGEEIDIENHKPDTWKGAASVLKHKYGLNIYPFVLVEKVRKSCKSLSIFC